MLFKLLSYVMLLSIAVKSSLLRSKLYSVFKISDVCYVAICSYITMMYLIVEILIKFYHSSSNIYLLANRLIIQFALHSYLVFP